MLGAAGLIGADARVPAMVILRAPLGRRGSFLPTALNVAQCLGWATFELIIIAAAAAALSDEMLGVEARSAWTIVFGCVAAALALMGPIGVVRRFLRRSRSGPCRVARLSDLVDPVQVGERPRRALGEVRHRRHLVLARRRPVIAITVSWVPLVADYSRFSRTGGPAIGSGWATSWARRCSSSASGRCSSSSRGVTRTSRAAGRDRGRRGGGGPCPARA